MITRRVWGGRGVIEKALEAAGRGCHYVMAILEATVRSLSSFALFLLKACCRQSSIFVQEWCSGRRCCKRGEEDLLGGGR